jgi:hypothetical protein
MLWTFREEELCRINLHLLLFPAVKLTENSHRYEMRLLMLLIAVAVQTGASITVEFLGTIRILVAKYFDYRNELPGINFAGVPSEVCIDTRTKTDFDKGNKSPHPPHAKKGYCHLFTSNVEHIQCACEALCFCKRCLLLMRCCLQVLVERLHR